jgi:hypothetical protein
MSGLVRPFSFYDELQPIAFVGMKVDSMNDNVESWPSMGPIPFGCVCTFGDAGVGGRGTRKVGVGNNPVGPVAGIALHDHIIGAYGTGYRLYDAVSVLTRGRVWAQVDPVAAPIQEGEPVSFMPDTGFVTTGAAGGALLMPNATFRSKVISIPPVWPSEVLGACTIAIVELHYPNYSSP